MDRGSKESFRFFKDWGRKGGVKRSKSLSSWERSSIARKAACARWGKVRCLSKSMTSIRLDKPSLADPVFLEELLSEGSLEDWKKIYQTISEYPFGRVSQMLERVLANTSIYGVTPLWNSVLRSFRSH